VDFVASGKLGKICEVKAWINQTRLTIGRPPDGTPPEGVDYDAWLGPAPKRPFNPNRFHYNWRFFWDYGNSEIGNQGVHVLDVALWGIQKLRGMEKCMPDRISSTGGIYWLDDAKEVPDTEIVNYHYPDLLLSFELRSFGNDHILHAGQPNAAKPTDFYTAYYGTEGTLLLTQSGWTVYPNNGEKGPSEKGVPELHEQNFLECVKSRQRPNSDVEIGRLSTT
jgi:predicted dehydrogenase